MNYTGKVVIVTGAGRGIGRGIALAYASAGAHVILAEKVQSSGEETLNQIKHIGGKAEFIPTDVSVSEDIVSLVAQVEAKHGVIDILINNAGVSEWKSPYELKVEEWDRIMNTNLRSVFLCSREAAKVMRKRKKGSIVNIASTRAFMSEPHSEAYAATKGGILALTHALAASLAEDGIQVNAISPGWIETGNYSQLRGIDHKQHFSGRVGKPEDIARACLFLTDDDNDFITGTNLTIDGGMTKKMIYEP